MSHMAWVTAASPEGKPRDTVTSLKQCSTSAALVFPPWVQTDREQHLPFLFLQTQRARYSCYKPENCLNVDPFHMYRVPRSRSEAMHGNYNRYLFWVPKSKRKKSTTAFLGLSKKGKKNNNWEIDYSEQKRERWQICKKNPSAVVLETPAQQL